MTPRPTLGALRRALWIATIAATATAACSVPDRQPRPIDDNPRLDRLLAPETSLDTEPATGSEAAIVWVRDDALIRERSALVDGPVAEGDIDALNLLLDELSSGPSASAGGPDGPLRSAVPPDSIEPPVVLDDAVATVTVTTEFQRAVGREQLLAVGQIVGSIVGVAGVSAVRFQQGSEPIGVPVGDGSLTTAAVDSDDYVALLTPP